MGSSWVGGSKGRRAIHGQRAGLQALPPSRPTHERSIKAVAYLISWSSEPDTKRVPSGEKCTCQHSKAGYEHLPWQPSFWLKELSLAMKHSRINIAGVPQNVTSSYFHLEITPICCTDGKQHIQWHAVPSRQPTASLSHALSTAHRVNTACTGSQHSACHDAMWACQHLGTHEFFRQQSAASLATPKPTVMSFQPFLQLDALQDGQAARRPRTHIVRSCHATLSI